MAHRYRSFVDTGTSSIEGPWACVPSRGCSKLYSDGLFCVCQCENNATPQCCLFGCAASEQKRPSPIVSSESLPRPLLVQLF